MRRNALYPADASDQFGGQQSSIACFVDQPTDGREPDVDGRWCKLPNLQLCPILEDHAAAESEAGLRAIPVDEFIHGMLISRDCKDARLLITDLLVWSSSGSVGRSERLDFLLLGFFMRGGFPRRLQ